MSEFDYPLPTERIAQRPVEPRDSARLLVDEGPWRAPGDRHVRDLHELVGSGDVVVMNETRVLAARLALLKPTGGAVEVFLLEAQGDGTWSALVKPSRRVADGIELTDASGRCVVRVVSGHATGDRRVIVTVDDVAIADAQQAHLLDGVGETPLPPYIRAGIDDPERYQTIYARSPGSVAAPTAGLHLTSQLLDRVRRAGAEVHTVELVVGIDTFRPVMVDDTDDHVMHSEAYVVPDATMQACRDADRVIAIGTTTVRALESAAARSPHGRTDLFITRGYDWKVVDAMMTNFHMPRSTLLVMIDAFVGPRWRELYDAALATDYRFLSFGDAMFLRRSAT